jgi:adenylate/guanylate cyclase family protein/GAF domain-containing protein
MKRRSGGSSERGKSRGRKATVLKRGNAPKATRNRGVSIAGQETVVARLTHERDEALLRETANSEILRLISKSPGDLELVFRSILENATRICNANFGTLFRFDGENYLPAAQFNTPAALLEALTRRGPFKPTPGISLEHVMRTKQVFHNADMAAEPVLGLATKLGGARTQVTVPMLKDDALTGAIVIYRKLEAQSEELVKLNQQLEQRVTDQVGEIERMGRLRRFLPPQVADLIVASGTEKQLESHRREITALFCDLRGFTGFSESSDPEDVIALLRDYHAAIGKIIIKYSGTLERFAGDGVMVIFNDPVPVENPALQAVLMALDMRHDHRLFQYRLCEPICRLAHRQSATIGR